MCNKLLKGFIKSALIYMENNNIIMLCNIYDIQICKLHLNIQYMSGESMIFDIWRFCAVFHYPYRYFSKYKLF